MRLYGIDIAKRMNIESLRKDGMPFTYLEMKNLGAPVASSNNRIVAVTDMKVGDYTIAAQPGVPRPITITHATDTVTDTLGTITIEGTNILDEVISETLVPTADDTIATEQLFKTVTKVTGAGWVISAPTDEDQIQLGVDDMIGVPVDLESSHQIIFAMLGTAIIAPEDIDDGQVELMPNAGIDVNTATYDGAKTLRVLVAFNRDYTS